MAFEAPTRLVRALGESVREADDGWLDALPRLLETAVSEGGLTVERLQLPGGRSSLVALVRDAAGTPAALKLAPPGSRPAAEAAALAHWDGHGAARLLSPADQASSGMLLERLHADMSVRSLPEAKSMLEAAGALRRLWVEPPAFPFETVAERTGRQAEAMRACLTPGDPVEPLVTEALAARDELLATPPQERLLHGTYRQSKVLSAERLPWLAVGPDPVVGECAFDLARLVRDRVEDVVGSPSGSSITRRRVKRLAESLDVDATRLRGWTLFRAVESGVRARRVGRVADSELLLEFAAWL
ncbi:aminoglycoside phosphotransferase family protein [Streptomyces mesophilus]|uniref:aminoglycoside phosphotransferase family protein n=1 Tax=Streptomyces mesophilus TaxID=1775132 RepID=UPI00332441C9